MFADAFRGRTVWISGHTGFKGSWLTNWLLQLGARIHGFALDPPTTPSLFDQTGLAALVRHQIGDIRDAIAVERSMVEAAPDFVFHLAAQPLVRSSYEQPVETYDTNVMGTVHVLDSLRRMNRPCAAVFVTTDKCYENREWVYAYREVDALGGFDPYSSSKAAAELIIAAYRQSFFHPHTNPRVRIASARAGNVIGGGDWALDRIVPDSVRALQDQAPIPVRNPHSTRPWQHVLEPLSGYLWLATKLLLVDHTSAAELCSPFNFGPQLNSNRPVTDLVTELLQHWPGQWKDCSDSKAPHEARLLNLATDKAFHLLAWAPVWSFSETVAQTARWYRRASTSAQAAELFALTREQIEQYGCAAARQGVSWACS